jgi:hypothetical protein
MLAAIISASVAIFVLIVSKWLEYRNSQTSMLRLKLEDYLVSIDQIIEAARFPLMDGVPTPESIQSVYSRHAGDFIFKIQKPNMLANLYFPDSLPRAREVYMAAGKMNAWFHNIADPALPYTHEEGTEIFSLLNTKVNELREYLIAEQGRLTRRIPHTLFD